MIYELTQDISFINRCMTEPAVWQAGIDDGLLNVKPEVFFVPTEGKIWLKCGEYGLLMGEPRNAVTYEAHVALLPEARGRAVTICKGALDWMFGNTNCLRITALVPSYNRFALALAYRIGMDFVGIHTKSFLKDGKLYDQHIFGISKEVSCHH